MGPTDALKFGTRGFQFHRRSPEAGVREPDRKLLQSRRLEATTLAGQRLDRKWFVRNRGRVLHPHRLEVRIRRRGPINRRPALHCATSQGRSGGIMRNRIRERATVRALPLTATAPATIPREQDESSGWGPTPISHPTIRPLSTGMICVRVIPPRQEEPVTPLLRRDTKRLAILRLRPSRPGMRRPVRVTQRHVRPTQHPLCRGRNFQDQITPHLIIRPLPPRSVALPPLGANPVRVAAVGDARPALQDQADGSSADIVLYTLKFQKQQPLRNPGVICSYPGDPGWRGSLAAKRLFCA